MIVISDGHTWCLYMLTIYDHNTWWSNMMSVYDDHIWWSYMMIIYDDHIWSPYMIMVWWYHLMTGTRTGTGPGHGTGTGPGHWTGTETWDRQEYRKKLQHLYNLDEICSPGSVWADSWYKKARNYDKFTWWRPWGSNYDFQGFKKDFGIVFRKCSLKFQNFASSNKIEGTTWPCVPS